MRRRIIIDTGPLAAFLNRREKHHEWVRDIFSTLTPPVMTCEAVISEVCFLVRPLPQGQDKVLDLLSRGIITLPFRLEGEIPSLLKLMKKYADVPISVADACLIRMCEKDARAEVLTLDSDFLRYRKNGREVIDVIFPHEA